MSELKENPRDIPLESIKAEVAQWLDTNWRIDRPLAEWRELLVDAGWGAPEWPVEYFGRGYSAAQAEAVAQVFSDKGAVGVAQGGPGKLASHTILAHGSEAQKQKYLRPILTLSLIHI